MSKEAMDAAELKCPFCNGRVLSKLDEAAMKYGQDGGYWWIGCDDDDCEFSPGNHFPAEAEALRAWGNRQETAALRAEVEALRAERDELLKQRGILEVELIEARDREAKERRERVQSEIDRTRKSLDY